MKLKIEKDRVLEAAKACPSSLPVLKTLFPEAFEPEDDLAIKKGTFNQADYPDLSSFCDKAFGYPDAIKISVAAPDYLIPSRSDLRYRSLYIHGSYDVELLKLGSRNGTILVFKHRTI